MGNFREIIGRDLASSLEADYSEVPIDRIGAFSKASRLGTLLWRLKFSHDAAAYKPAVLLLAKYEQLGTPIGTRLVELAIKEWLLPQCQFCNGAKEMIIGLKRVICPQCEGYGMRRYTDRERNAFLGSPFKGWRRKYNRMWSNLGGNEKIVNPVMDAQLER